MFKPLTALSLAAFLLLGSIVSARPTRDSVIISTMKGIVRIQIKTPDDESHVCTGFAISPTVAITAQHCVLPFDNALLVDNTQQKVLKRGPLFSLISIPSGKTPLKISKQISKLGDNVLSFGYAYGASQISVFSRMIAAMFDQDLGLDGVLIPGMSGGPIVNNYGDVVGLNQGSNSEVAVGCGIIEINAFLNAKE